jgi:hypothetical protein
MFFESDYVRLTSALPTRESVVTVLRLGKQLIDM